MERIDPIDTSSLVDKVEKRIIAYIQENQLNVGDALPKELDLASTLNVSRTVIREALLRLRTIGLIESKKHKGAVITSPDLLRPLKKVFHPSVIDDSTLKDLFEMRLALEVGMADMVINNISSADLEELEAIANEVGTGEAISVWPIEDEIRFHGKLYRITKNNVLLELQELLLPIFKFVHESVLFDSSPEQQDFVSHKELVEVLKLRDADLFRKAMRKHLHNHFVRVQ